jgi:hypothetical protein
MRCLRAAIVIPLLFPALHAQSVISVRFGLINYSEGAVFVDNQPVVNRFGRYASLKDGSDLLTQDGRAELLLTPGAYLRLGQNSGLRLISGDLSGTEAELLSGSAILDSGNALAGAPITLVVRDIRIRVEEPSRLRIDAEPPQLRVYKGKVEVQGAGSQTEVLADQVYPLDGSSVVQRMTDGADDLLDIWSQQRNRVIYFNLASAQNIGDPQDDPGSADAGALYSAGVYSGAGSAGLSGWPGYLPLATIQPMTNLYVNPLPGYYGIYAPFPYGVYGVASRVGFVSGYRFAPVYPGTLSPYRGISFRPAPGFGGTSGTLTPRPVLPRAPVILPRAAPHR